MIINDKFAGYFCFYLLLSAILMACGGSGGDDSDAGGPNSAPEGVLSGIFVDSPVEGLDYQTVTQQGITNARGEFHYKDGEVVSFYIGNIFIGNAVGAPILSPLSLVADTNSPFNPTVTNITRFLMSLDDDNDPENGIVINQEARTAGETLAIQFNVDYATFEADENVRAMLTASTGMQNSSLVDVTVAQNHLATTLSSWGSMTWGTGNWKAAD